MAEELPTDLDKLDFLTLENLVLKIEKAEKVLRGFQEEHRRLRVTFMEKYKLGEKDAVRDDGKILRQGNAPEIK